MASANSFKKTIRNHWAFYTGLLLTIGGAVAVTAACCIWPAFITGLLAFTLSVGALTFIPFSFMAGIVSAPLIAQALAVGFVALCGLAAAFFIFNSVVAVYNALDKLFNPPKPQKIQWRLYSESEINSQTTTTSELVTKSDSIMAGARSFKKTIRNHWAFSTGLMLTIGGAAAVTAACCIWPAFITGLLAFTLSVGALTFVPFSFMAGIVTAPLIAQALAVGFVALCGLAITFFIFNSVVAVYNALDKLFNPPNAQQTQSYLYFSEHEEIEEDCAISTRAVSTSTPNLLKQLESEITSETFQKEISVPPRHFPPLSSMQNDKLNTNQTGLPVSPTFSNTL